LYSVEKRNISPGSAIESRAEDSNFFLNCKISEKKRDGRLTPVCMKSKDIKLKFNLK
jgi:hypothetical protein